MSFTHILRDHDVLPAWDTWGIWSLGHAGVTCALQPWCHPPASPTLPGPAWGCALFPRGDSAAFSSLSFFLRIKAPACPLSLCPHGTCACPSRAPVPQLIQHSELTPNHRCHPTASRPSTKAARALHKPGPATWWHAHRLRHLLQVLKSPSCAGPRLQTAVPGACRANEKHMGPTSGSD